ncbi:MAG: prohibitin family protein [Bacteroidales bacterium]|jgi:prohibitin 1|nr:prohibitin family protein [Bacteroidales bacterium]
MQAQQEFDLKKVLPIGIGVFALLILIISWSSMTTTIRSGQGGVLFRLLDDGVDTEVTYGEGFHFILPWNNMFIYEVRQQEQGEKMTVLSSNGLEISVDVSIWYQPSYAELGKLHQEKGLNYLATVVKPAIRSATRSVIGRYTPEQIYSSKRDAIQSEIFQETRDLLISQYVQINEVLVRDIILPPTLKMAIENKLKQEQESLEYEFKLEKATKEAQRIEIDALGKANANRILSASLTAMILREKGIEATLKLAESPNSKVVIIGSGADGMPLILGDTK